MDDNASNLFVLEKLLLLLNYECDKATNGLECVNKVQMNFIEYGLILMDINMPLMNGIEAAYKLG